MTEGNQDSNVSADDEKAILVATCKALLQELIDFIRDGQHGGPTDEDQWPEVAKAKKVLIRY